MTIVTHGRECALGTAVDGNVILSNPGHAVAATWNQIPQHFTNVVLDEFVIMPNHVHGIIMITDDEHVTPRGMGGFRRGDAFGILRAGSRVTLFPNASLLPHGTVPGSLGAILQNFKSISTRRINGMQNTPGLPFWQRDDYEHVIHGKGEASGMLRACSQITQFPDALPQ